MALMGLTAAAQAQTDPAAQATPGGLSKAGSTKPLETGTPLPSTCVPGQMFFKTDAPAGANLYACTADNTWSLRGGIAGSDCWADAASQTLRCRDKSGNVYAVVKTAAGGTAGAAPAPGALPRNPLNTMPGAGLAPAVTDPGAQINVHYPLTEKSTNFDIPAFGICYAPGCGSESSVNLYFISAPNGVTFDECGVSIATPPVGSSVVIDIQTPAGVSIFGAMKLVIPIASSATIFQSNFANSPQLAAKGDQFKAVVLQNDSAGRAQFAYVKCRVH
jgi:hypothetical protein